MTKKHKLQFNQMQEKLLKVYIALTNFHSFVAIFSCRPKSYFFVFSSLLLFPPEKTLVLRCFSMNSKVIY